MSLFQSQYEGKQAVCNNAVFNAFATLCWLTKEAVAKSFSLLKLFHVVCVDKMQYFNHKSPGAIREIFLHIGTVLSSIKHKSKKSGFFRLLINEVTDISVTD